MSSFWRLFLRHDEGTIIEAGNAHCAKHSAMNITAAAVGAAVISLD
jgi:hypothetical protein